MMTPDIGPVLTRWRDVVEQASAELRELTEDRARRRPAPGKWSVKEIVGHLIDSAANNHRRFVVAQIRPGLVFDGYEQDEWVTRQAYQYERWPDLVTLWTAYNLHLIHVVTNMSPSLLAAPQQEHNLDEIASRPVSRGDASTLGFLVDDYLFHLEHHLAQIRALMA